MAGKCVLIVNLVVFILSQVTDVESSKLNVPRVLLPIFNDFSTNFTLEVTEGGCYKWSTSRLDLVQIIPVDMNNENECCSKVIVSTISKEQTRNTAIVLAEEFYTGQVLRCDVIVDVICNLQIITTTRELFMEEAPEAFEVRAYDDQGNEFTSLEGIQFDWALSCLGSSRPGSNDNVLRFITFKDSPYETPPSIEAFEESGTQGHIILLEGVKTGSAKVSVKLPHKEYKDVKPVEVQLMVVANLIIEPADIYILRGDVINYRIIQVKHGRLEEINLPSSQYYLDVEDYNVGVIDQKSGCLTGMNVGKTRVQLHDRNVDDNDGSLKLPTATVSVIIPAYITLTLLPHRNWAILFGEQHDLIVEVYASNDHKIHLGEGVQFKTDVDESRFFVQDRSSNGSWLTGRAKDQGIASVHTTLMSVVSKKLGKVNLEPPLTARAEIVIFPRIVLVPHEVVLPWDPVVRPRYEIEMKATGGDGKFLWSTTNRTVGSVTQLGLVRTQWHGQLDVCAAMSRNHHNKNCARVSILPPTKLEIVEFVMEAEIGSPLFLHVALYAEMPGQSALVPMPFIKCKEMPLKVKISEQNFMYNNSATTEPVGVSCTTVGVVGLSVGSSRITVSYTRDDIFLEDSVTVSSYRPLELLEPSSGETVLAVGTSRFLVFTGGPRPWPSRPTEHTVQTASSNRKAVLAVDMTEAFKIPGEPDTYVISVTCRELGESTVTLTVANRPLFPNCKHRESFASANVVCGKPRSVRLRPDLKLPEAHSCPMDLSADKVVVQSYKNIELDVIVQDDNGKRFDNISSLLIKWQTNPKQYASVMNRDNAFPSNTSHGNVVLPCKSYQVVVPQSQCGTVDVTATITGYRADVLKKNKVKAENPPFFTAEENPLEPAQISATITFYLVDDAQVSPNRTSVYNHPLNKVYLSVQQGSGYYELGLSADDLAHIKYVEGSREIEIVPRHNGEVHVTLSDLCLTSALPAQVTVNIVSVNSIVIEMPDRVEIGKCIPVVVRFYDDLDEPMPLPKLDYLDVRYVFEDEIASLKQLPQNPSKPWPVGEVHYVLTGVQLGDTKLVFSTGLDKVIRSPAVPVQVFPPLRLQPRNITMLIGSNFELVVQGGPQPDGNIEFNTSVLNVIDITPSGLLHGLAVGHTRVEGKSVTVHPATGQRIVLSQDAVDVYVIPLAGVKISAPLTRFLQGTTVPAWASSAPESMTPIVLGTIDPPIKFMWSAQCNDVVLLHGPFHHTGVRIDPADQATIRIKGLKPGRCSIDLKVVAPGIIANKKTEVVFRSSIELEVYEELLLTSPPGFSGKSILLAPFTKLQLHTNRDGLSYIKYSLQNENDGDANNKSLSLPNSIVTITQSGLLQSYGSPGRVMILITAVDEHGLKQTLNLVVQVKPVHYMMVNVATDWMISADEIATALPVGGEFRLITSFHDNTGAAFTAAQSDVRHRLSRSDVLEARRAGDNASFHAALTKPGVVVLKIYTEGTHKTADYVKFHAEQLNRPLIFDVTSGDIICLWSPVTSRLNEKGSWTPDSAHLAVNPATGVAQIINAHNELTSVTYSLTPAANLHFNIEPISHVSLIYDKIDVITNSKGYPSLHVPVLFSGTKTRDTKTSNLHSGWMCQNLLSENIKYFPFTCEIAFSNQSIGISIYDVLDVYPAFNENLGYYSCDFVAVNDITVNSSLIESNITLTVTTDSVVQSVPIELKYIPAAFIQNNELHLNDNQFSAQLIVIGLPAVLKQLKIEAADSSLLHVGKQQRIAPNTVSYEIELIDYHWKLNELQDLLSVFIKSDLTKQYVKIPVKTHISQDKVAQPLCMSGTMGSPTGNFFYNYKQALITLLSVIILIFITFYAYANYVQPVININLPSNQPRPPYNSNRFSPADRTFMTTSGFNNSANRSFGCSPSTCYNRPNMSASPNRFSDGDNSFNDRSCLNPDVRRDKKFL